MSVEEILCIWESDVSISSNITAKKIVPARNAKYVQLPDDLHPSLKSALNRLGIDQLYTHQFETWKELNRESNVVISTGTSSGKSLGFNLPVFNQILSNGDTRALYIYPTKALAQDQHNSIIELSKIIASLNSFEIISGVYDGDTPQSVRRKIRSEARIILSNPDMVHVGILPHHTGWESFFKNLRYIIIDEIHIYRGVFGSHIANVLRRLIRIANFYGTNPQLIMTSATIANPKDHAEKLTGSAVSLITNDGSERGLQVFLVYTPPIINSKLGIRRSAIHECADLAIDLIKDDIQTIIFGRTRRTIEITLAYLREKLSGSERNINSIIRGYRSGYLPNHRRNIEKGLKSGIVRAIVATNALELGIDIRGLGAVFMLGYPGTISACIQQSGRAGRGADGSLAILLATADPLDQFLAKHPDYLFQRNPENALINPDNPLILLSHIECAAFELPFIQGNNFGTVNTNLTIKYLDFLSDNGEIRKLDGKYYWMSERYPARDISLRSTTDDTITLIEQIDDVLDTQGKNHQVVGTIEKQSALSMTHPGAIYLHEGETYLVETLDLDSNVAKISRINPDYYTTPQQKTELELLTLLSQKKIRGGDKYIGEIMITSQVTGFKRIRWVSHEIVSISKLSLPSTELITSAYWLSLSDSIIQVLEGRNEWSNERINYGKDWDDIREYVRKRDHYQCQVCGKFETGRNHDVHHKIPFKAFTSKEEANRSNNLITLCRICHRKAEISVYIRSGLAGVAYILGHIAPIHLMCDRRDLGVHYDTNSPLNKNRATIVIYEMTPAGIGFSDRLFEIHEKLVRDSNSIVQHCVCENGCPSCIGPVSDINIGGKKEAIAIFDELIRK